MNQNYKTADQTHFVGVAGNNMAQDYRRYKDELERQRAEREAAEKKAKGDWWKRAIVNGIGGAIQGGAAGGIGGAIAGGVGGAGLSAVGDAAGISGLSSGMGGANLGGSAGLAYRRFAARAGSPTGALPMSSIPDQPMAPPPPTGMSNPAGVGGFGPMDEWDLFDRRRGGGYY